MAAEEPRSLIDGAPSDLLPVSDRGFAYGDGVFRTIRIDRGQPWLWSDHMAKLASDCTRLGLPLSQTVLADLRDEVESLVAEESGVLRLVVTRGSGPRGDRPPVPAQPRRVMTFHPGAGAPAGPLARSVRLCRVRLPEQRELAGIKHLNRLPQVLARTEWSGSAPAEGLLLDHEGSVICGTMSNVFVRIDECVLTPRMDRCGVAGVVRSRLLGGELPAIQASSLTVEEARVTLDDLERADELWLTNAVIGLWSVAALEDAESRHLRSWPEAPSQLAQALFADLTALGAGS